MSNWYSKKQKVLFIHIPKTGGFSIRESLLDNPTMHFGNMEGFDYDFSFAIARNPFDRFCSTLAMFRDGGLTCKNPLKPDLTADELIRILKDDNIGYKNNRENINEFIKHHALPMTHPYNCLNLAQYIFRYENYQEAYDVIARKLDKPTKLKHLNKSTNFDKDYRKILSGNQRKELEEIYDFDLKSFNYKF